MLELIVFYIAAIVAVGAAVMVVFQRNPIASVLYLIVSFIAQAILLVQLKALFIGVLLVIVYAGAILVLFLFVIMLLNLRGEKFGDKKPALNRISKMTLVTFFFLEFMIIIKQMTFPQSIDNSIAPAAADFGSVKPVAELLYIKYIYPFELTSILLLVAIIGAVVMAKKGKEDNREED